MRYEVTPSRDFPGDWVAGAVDTGRDGEIHIALFSGPQARDRAKEYAAWKNAVVPVPV
jgi:hypothetical protein